MTITTTIINVIAIIFTKHQPYALVSNTEPNFDQVDDLRVHQAIIRLFSTIISAAVFTKKVKIISSPRQLNLQKELPPSRATFTAMIIMNGSSPSRRD